MYECTDIFGSDWVVIPLHCSGAHLAGLQHVDLFFIHSVLVFRKETFTLVFNLPTKQTVTKKPNGYNNQNSISSFFWAFAALLLRLCCICDGIYQHLTNKLTKFRFYDRGGKTCHG